LPQILAAIRLKVGPPATIAAPPPAPNNSLVATRRSSALDLYGRNHPDEANVNSSAEETREPAASTDASLLRRFRRGEEDAATELYLRYARRLMAFAEQRTSRQLTSRFDPEDVIQSVFRTFFRRAADGSFDVPAGEELWQLLLVIALNKVRRLGRYHHQQRRDVEKTLGGEALEDRQLSATEQSVRMLEMVVDEALQQLPDVQRQMVELRIQGYSVVEIAETTRRCRRTVERVMRQFRQYISDYVVDEAADADA
jgi:RNA polymerase sigma-70 factor (ECF subfamily)